MSQEIKKSSVLSSSSSTTTRPQDNKSIAGTLPQPLPLGDAKVAALLKPVKVNIAIKQRYRDTAFADEIFAEPYSCDTGDVYEWEQITHWLKTHDTSPKTNERLESKKLRPARDKQEDVQEFLDENPELRDSEELYLPRHWVKELEQACQEGDIATIKRLCERDKRLLHWTFNFDKAEGLVDRADYERWHGKNMLHLACQSGTHDALVQLITLIEKQTLGLALHLLLQTDSQGYLPLHHAIAREQDTAIFSNVMAWMKNQWHNLILPPALLDKADAKGQTPLHRAILAGSLETVKWLMTQKASVTAQNHAGQNALHLAAMADHVEMLQLLLHQGMPLNAQDQTGNTALHLAAAAGSQTTVAALLRAGSSPTIKNKAGQTARECAPDPATAACYDLITAQLREKEAETLKARGPLGVLLLQQQELIRQQQVEIDLLRERIAKLEAAKLAPGMPPSSPQKSIASSSGFGLFDEKKQAPAAQPVVDEKALVQLLKLVAEGEQDQAEALIKKDSKLLLAAGKVTDLSGHTFDNITAFQYALWAMDYHMWTMIQKYLPEEAQAKQHATLESKGTAHGKHFDLQPLLGALKTYVDNYNAWSYDQCEEQWCKKVGGAQKLLPVHVVNEYCRPDRPFDPCPTEWTAKLPRTREVGVYINSKWVEGSWFLPPTPSEVLGSSFAFYRSCELRGAWSGRGGRGARAGGMVDRGWIVALSDLKSLQALWNARTEQLKALSDSLAAESQSSMQKWSS